MARVPKLAWAAAVLAAAGCSSVPIALSAGPESVAIPGTPVAFELVQVPGGGPGRLQPFWIGAHEVTWDEFDLYWPHRKLMKADGITRPSEPFEPPNLPMEKGRAPVVNVRWHAAMGYCEWLSTKTGQTFRLPTEAEWEQACGADPAAARGEVAWHRGNSGGKTHPAGKKKPNAWGLYDILGNAWETCLEPLQPPAFGPVLRGGAWNTPPAAVDPGSRTTPQSEWEERDTKRPRSLWWFSDAPFAGFRLVRVGDAAGRKEREAYAARIEIGNVKVVEAGPQMTRVAGVVRNGGDRTLDELQLKVGFAGEDGKPLLEDEAGRPPFTWAFPVLAHSAHPGPHREPLRPGESRDFVTEVPTLRDEVGPLEEPGTLWARVVGLRFHKE